MQFENESAFPAIGWPSLDNKGNGYVSMVVRVKYLFNTLDKEGVWSLKLDPTQGDLFDKDTYYTYDLENEFENPIRYESDFIAYKPHADLIVNINTQEPAYHSCAISVERFKVKKTGKIASSPTVILSKKGVKKLGVRPRTHKKRLSYAGTFDTQWTLSKAPIMPDDFNEVYNNAAYPDMQLEEYGYFQAGDIFHLEKVFTGDRVQSFILPGFYFKGTVYGDNAQKEVLLDIDTVLIEAGDTEMQNNALYVSYRKRVPHDKVANRLLVEMIVPQEFTQVVQKEGA